MRQKGSNLHEPLKSVDSTVLDIGRFASIRFFTTHKVNLNAEKLDERLYGKINGVYLL